MNRITLQEYLETHKHLHIGMKVSSELLDNMVVRGFVNSSKDMIDDSKINMTKKDSLLSQTEFIPSNEPKILILTALKKKTIVQDHIDLFLSLGIEALKELEDDEIKLEKAEFKSKVLVPFKKIKKEYINND